MAENTINPITVLNINGEDVKAKATFLFDKKLKNLRQKKKIMKAKRIK